MAGEDRTEAATPRRLQQAREDGQIAFSREVPALVGLGAGTLVLSAIGPALSNDLLLRLEPFLALGHQGVGPALAASAAAIGLLAGPVVLGVGVASVASSAMQTGFLLSPRRLRPDFTRLNPMQGARRLFGPTGLVEAARSVVKVAVLGVAEWRVLSRDMPDLARAVFWLPGQLAGRLYHASLRVAVVALLVQVLFAAADLAWVRYRHARQLRMSKEDVRQDARDTDGNPQIKQRLRQLRLGRARKRMLAAVPSATVVVTNPTHYAVALAYDRNKGGAPRVVAKGMDEVAARIREAAQNSGVPLVANPPLARALHAVELDSEIPPEHFKVVAELIAYVWRLRGRVGGS